MNDPNRFLKWLLVIGMIVISLVVLYPPEQKLKGGIDLVGGTSLLYEIDTTGLEPGQMSELSARVMRILRERVDPNGQLNLEWRPVGATRLEVRMPRPPKAAEDRRTVFNNALAKITEHNLSRFQIESALGMPAANRKGELDTLSHGVAERAPLFDALIKAFDDKTVAKAGGDAAATETAVAAYEKAMADLLATSLPTNRLTDILALSKGTKRNEELQRLRTEFPSYDSDAKAKLITNAAAAFEAWTANKGSLEDPSDLKRRLRGAGVLEFRILADRDPSSPGMTKDADPALQQDINRYTEQLKKFGPRLKAGDRYKWIPVHDAMRFTNAKSMADVERLKGLPGSPILEEYTGRYYVLVHNDAAFSMLKSQEKRKWSLVSAFPDRNPLTGQNVVSFVLDARGGQLFRQLTGPHIGRQLAITLDESAMSHATIKDEIGERCQISGNFTVEDVQDLVSTLDAGSLPARLKDTPLSEKTIGPSLGETNRANGIRAAVGGMLCVVVFVIIYYGFMGGGMADVALALNLLFTLAIMALMQSTFTLPGIAGLVLAIGMAIDANVLIFERIREERARGAAFRKALNAGYEKAFSAIFDGNLTTLITCVILGYVGSEEVKGFAVTLGIGIATSMFTALTVTRLVFNTMAANGILDDFRMLRVIGIPNINWIELRKTFWPVSTALVIIGLGLFMWMGVARTQTLFDIEFLGGTSVQVDLKPGMTLSDEEVRAAVTDVGAGKSSATQWLIDAADELGKATVADGDQPGRFAITSTKLRGDELAALIKGRIESKIERGGVQASERTAVFEGKSGQLTLESFRQAVTDAAAYAREAANRLAGARVQSVGGVEAGTRKAKSFEVATTETDRGVVQAAIVARLRDRLQIQLAVPFEPVRDEVITKEPFFVVEGEDQYLSDVIGGMANFDVREFRGGVVVYAKVNATTDAVTAESVDKRLNEIVLQPEYEQYSQRKRKVFPLGGSTPVDGSPAYREFAIAAVDESLLFDQDRSSWTDGLAAPMLQLVTAALSQEKSLPQVIQFDKQVAGQSSNRAVFASILAMLAIGAYVWFRFGTKDFGLAVLVCLVHDVAIVLGAVGLSHYVGGTALGSLLMIEDFKVDLTMVAAVLTIIGYSLNDTIVVFDRIRENKGKLGNLSANLINASINQTLSRTVLTSTTVFLVVLVLYIFGGDGIHGFAYAMLIGTISGTYSTVAIAVPLVYRPATLRTVTVIIAAAIAIGAIFVTTDVALVRGVLAAVTLVICGIIWSKMARTPVYGQREAVGA